MHARRPPRRIIAIPNRGIVVEQRIKPHVGNMAFIKGNGNFSQSLYEKRIRPEVPTHKGTNPIETKIRLYELDVLRTV